MQHRKIISSASIIFYYFLYLVFYINPLVRASIFAFILYFLFKFINYFTYKKRKQQEMRCNTFLNK